MQVLHVIFDSVKNSVFFSEVLRPLVDQALNQPEDKFYLVSFEPNSQDAYKFLASYNCVIPGNLTIKIFERLPFWGRWTLRLAANVLHDNLISEINFATCQARGVFAAFILHKALSIKEKNQITKAKHLLQKHVHINKPEIFKVYIPGIASEEVLLVDWVKQNRLINFIKKLKGLLQCIIIFQVEKEVFESFLDIRFLVCSEAMANYLLTAFKMSAPQMEINPFVYEPCDFLMKLELRESVRNELKISYDSIMYVFSGGMQPWQNFELSVSEFMRALKRDPESFFLVLTKDVRTALSELYKQGVPSDRFKVLDLRPDQVKRYLMSADYGLLFRDANLVNWTAAPVKAKEYLSAGILTLHNGTIHSIIKNC